MAHPEFGKVRNSHRYLSLGRSKVTPVPATGVTPMTSNPASIAAPAAHKPGPSFVLLTPKETAKRLNVSTSWLAKARMRGDGPPFIKVGRCIRYSDAALLQWMKGRQRLSTSEQ